MTMPANIAKDPVKRRAWLLKYCGEQDDQTLLSITDDKNSKQDGESE